MTKELSCLKPKEKGIIKEIKGNNELKTRLQELGLIKNTVVEVVRYAPFEDPIEIKINNTYLALRKKDAENILVEVFKDKK
jgi:ferrous iron transport protein A